MRNARPRCPAPDMSGCRHHASTRFARSLPYGVAMWQTRRAIYLEPGEVAVLAAAARQAAERSEPHPRQGLFLAAAAAFDKLAAGDGLLVVPASSAAARRAARFHVVASPPRAPAPKGARSGQPSPRGLASGTAGA